MEISPIPGIRILPVARVQSVDPELSAVFDIEAAIRADEDNFTRNGRKPAGGEEPEEEDALNEEIEDAPEQEFDSTPAPKRRADRISFSA